MSFKKVFNSVVRVCAYPTIGIGIGLHVFGFEKGYNDLVLIILLMILFEVNDDKFRRCD